MSGENRVATNSTSILGQVAPAVPQEKSQWFIICYKLKRVSQSNIPKKLRNLSAVRMHIGFHFAPLVQWRVENGLNKGSAVYMALKCHCFTLPSFYRALPLYDGSIKWLFYSAVVCAWTCKTMAVLSFNWNNAIMPSFYCCCFKQNCRFKRNSTIVPLFAWTMATSLAILVFFKPASCRCLPLFLPSPIKMLSHVLWLIGRWWRRTKIFFIEICWVIRWNPSELFEISRLDICRHLSIHHFKFFFK